MAVDIHRSSSQPFDANAHNAEHSWLYADAGPIRAPQLSPRGGFDPAGDAYSAYEEDYVGALLTAEEMSPDRNLRPDSQIDRNATDAYPVLQESTESDLYENPNLLRWAPGEFTRLEGSKGRINLSARRPLARGADLPPILQGKLGDYVGHGLLPISVNKSMTNAEMARRADQAEFYAFAVPPNGGGHAKVEAYVFIGKEDMARILGGERPKHAVTVTEDRPLAIGLSGWMPNSGFELRPQDVRNDPSLKDKLGLVDTHQAVATVKNGQLRYEDIGLRGHVTTMEVHKNYGEQWSEDEAAQADVSYEPAVGIIEKGDPALDGPITEVRMPNRHPNPRHTAASMAILASLPAEVQARQDAPTEVKERGVVYGQPKRRHAARIGSAVLRSKAPTAAGGKHRPGRHAA